MSPGKRISSLSQKSPIAWRHGKAGVMPSVCLSEHEWSTSLTKGQSAEIAQRGRAEGQAPLGCPVCQLPLRRLWHCHMVALWCSRMWADHS